MLRSVAGITASSSNRVLLETVCNLSLSLDKRSLCVGYSSLSAHVGQFVFISLCMWLRDWRRAEYTTQNPSIRLTFHSSQLSSTSVCTTAHAPQKVFHVLPVVWTITRKHRDKSCSCESECQLRLTPYTGSVVFGPSNTLNVHFKALFIITPWSRSNRSKCIWRTIKVSLKIEIWDFFLDK